MTPEPETTVQDFRLALRSVAGLAALLGLALVYRRRGLLQHIPILLIGGAIALAAGGYALWALL